MDGGMIVAGCGPGEVGCNEPPPIDGYITFWAWVLVALVAVSVIAATLLMARRRRVRAARADVTATRS